MNARGVTQIAAILLSLSLPSSTAAALDPEKQPIYSNTANNSLCGTHDGAFHPSPCTVPSAQRLIIEHVSGYVFLPPSTNTTIGVKFGIGYQELERCLDDYQRQGYQRAGN
jgi:hypothetical protein